MCGISGFFPLTDREEWTSDRLQSNIKSMLSAIVHRGPDAEGVWIDPEGTGLTLGHRRLSIIDLTETGSQPMISHSRRYVICYNGEIYNHSYLYEQMKKDGYKDEMNGTSDTEILLEAMEFYGPIEAIKECKGMFGIAFYDRVEQTLTLIRDRIGEKPLYYGITGGRFVFASEIGAIKNLSESDLGIEKRVLRTYFKYGYIPAPYSIYTGIYKLEPGSYLTIKIKTGINKSAFAETDSNTLVDIQNQILPAKQTKYWSIDEVAMYGQSHLYEGSRFEASLRLEELLKDSIRGQMVSDVPLGAFLSAGIDSATVVSLMQSVSDRPVKTFTIGFEEKDFNEADAAFEIAHILGTEHTELYVTKQDALDVIPRLASMFGEPFADSSQIPTYLVSHMTRDHVTVSLSGDGGDELFAGYRDYAGVSSIYKKISGVPYPIRRLAGGLGEKLPIVNSKLKALHAHSVLLQARDTFDLYRRTFETDPLAAAVVKEDISCNSLYDSYDVMSNQSSDYNMFVTDPIHTAMLMNMHMYHPDDILAKVDRTAMSVSLETRVPLLDKDVIEFAWTLPLEYVKDANKGKLVLRDVLYRYVPEEIMDRPKKGFGVPIHKWLREGQLREWAEEKLNQDSINKAGLLDYNVVKTIWNQYVEQGIWRPVIWYILMFQSWMEL